MGSVENSPHLSGLSSFPAFPQELPDFSEHSLALFRQQAIVYAVWRSLNVISLIELLLFEGGGLGAQAVLKKEKGDQERQIFDAHKWFLSF